jgi:hypothetical protein
MSVSVGVTGEIIDRLIMEWLAIPTTALAVARPPV